MNDRELELQDMERINVTQVVVNMLLDLLVLYHEGKLLII